MADMPTPVQTATLPADNDMPVPEAPEDDATAAAGAGADVSSFAERAKQTYQTLTDAQGRTIQASIVKVMDSEVKIRRSDGLETVIPLNMLSEEDIAFCNYLRNQTKEEEVKAPAKTDGFDWDAYFNS